MMVIRLFLLGLLLPLLLAVSLLPACSTTDLRTPAIRELKLPLQEPRAGEATVTQLLDRLGGLTAWQDRRTMQVDFVDTWPDWFWRSFYMPWPKNDQQIRMQTLTGSFDSRAILIDGDNQKTYGIQAWRPWRLTKQDGQDRPKYEELDNIMLYLPTYQYFFEMPFRLYRAPILLDAGRKELAGKDYQLVFATWKGPEPNEHDQYLLFINKETGLLDKVQYSARDFADWAVGVVHMSDYRQVDGFWLPHAFKFSSDLAGNSVFHTFAVKGYAFDRVSETQVLADPNGPRAGDAKATQAQSVSSAPRRAASF